MVRIVLYSSHVVVAIGFENLGKIKLSSLSYQDAQLDIVLDNVIETFEQVNVGNEPKFTSEDDRFTTIPGVLPQQYFSYPALFFLLLTPNATTSKIY
jgi:hypothetical protein